MHDEPYSEEAEIGTLGSLLLDPNIVCDIAAKKGVTEGHFYIPANRAIAAIVFALIRQGKPVDVLTVAEEAARTKATSVSPALLDRIIDRTPTAAHAEYYIKILCDKYIAREGARSAHKFAEAITQDNAHPYDKIGRFINDLVGLSGIREQRTVSDYAAAHAVERQLAKTTGSSGIQSAYYSLENLLGSYRKGENVVVAGRTSTGKTAFVMNEVIHFCRNLKIPVAYQSPDMQASMLYERIAGCVSGVNIHRFRSDAWTDEDAASMDMAWKEVEGWPLTINDDRMTMDEICYWATAEKAKHGTQVLVLDFIGKVMRTKEEWRANYTEVMSEWSARLCDLGQRLDMVTIIISQFSRFGIKEKDITPEHPTLEAIKQCGEIENNADKVILLSQEPGQPVELFTSMHEVWNIDVDLAKNRTGPTGIKPFALHITTQRMMSRIDGDRIRDEINARRRSEARGW